MVGNATRKTDMTKLILDKETIESRLQVVPYITLHTKLRQLAESNKGNEEGICETPVYRPGFGAGSAYTFEGRRIKFVMNFVGKPRWNHSFDPTLTFNEPHDIAVDVKTNTLLTFARA